MVFGRILFASFPGLGIGFLANLFPHFAAM